MMLNFKSVINCWNQTASNWKREFLISMLWMWTTFQECAVCGTNSPRRLQLFNWFKKNLAGPCRPSGFCPQELQWTFKSHASWLSVCLLCILLLWMQTCFSFRQAGGWKQAAQRSERCTQQSRSCAPFVKWCFLFLLSVTCRVFVWTELAGQACLCTWQFEINQIAYRNHVATVCKWH